MSSNSGTMPPKLLPISTEYGEMDIQVFGQYKGASRNFVVYFNVLVLYYQNLEDKKGRGRVCSLAIVHSQDCIFKVLIYTTKFLEAPLYCPITCIPISPYSVDIGNSFEGIVPKFELMQHK